MTAAQSSYPVAPDHEWPEAWIMPDNAEDADDFDQCKENRCTPDNKGVTVQELKEIGIEYWKMDDVDKYAYPKIAVPYNPSDVVDPKLMSLRDSRGYSYADIITVHPDHLPNFDMKIKSFFEEHIHDAEEIRYILGGSGYFDVRNLQEQWVRVHVKKGDLITLPEGIYHRFTCDTQHLIHAMRLFVGEPIWTPFNRPQADDHPSRAKYVQQFIEERTGIKA